MIEYQPLSPLEIAELRQKEARGELTLEDCARFIASTRAAFLSRPAAVKGRGPKPKAGLPANFDPDADDLPF